MKTAYLLTPFSKKADNWIKNHLTGKNLVIGKSIAVEHRYIFDIVEAIKNEGLIKDFSIA